LPASEPQHAWLPDRVTPDQPVVTEDRAQMKNLPVKHWPASGSFWRDPLP
jgi:hypothetical protein